MLQKGAVAAVQTVGSRWWRASWQAAAQVSTGESVSSE